MKKMTLLEAFDEGYEACKKDYGLDGNGLYDMRPAEKKKKEKKQCPKHIASLT